jgi:hypothetical protein
MRSAAVAFAVTFAIGLGVLAAFGLSARTSTAYTLGVYPATAASSFERGDRLCQAPIRAPRGLAFDRVGFWIETGKRPGPELRVEVRDDETDRLLGEGTLAAGYPDFTREREHLVEVGRIQTDAPLRVCVINDTRRAAAVIGQVETASPSTAGTLNGKPIGMDLSVNLHTGDRSLLAALPDIADRASRFRPGWLPPIVYLLLGAALVVVGPVLLARAIARAAAADGA